MSVELLQAQTAAQQLLAQAVTLVPDFRGDSAEAAFYSKEGTLKATLTPSRDSVDTTVAAVGSSPDVLTLASASGVVVGRRYWLGSTNLGWSAKVRVSDIAGNVVTLDSAPPGLPGYGDTFKGLEYTAEIPGAQLATRGKSFRVDWRVTTGGVQRGYRQVVHVVAMQFRSPCTPDDAKRVALQSHRSWALSESFGTWLRISEDASDMVRKILTKDEDYPHWIGDQDAFRAAGEIACRIVLAMNGRVPPGFDGATYVTDQTARLNGAVRDAVGGVWVDRDESNSATDDEVRGAHNIGIERV